jgi:hypothetical protein
VNRTAPAADSVELPSTRRSHRRTWWIVLAAIAAIVVIVGLGVVITINSSVPQVTAKQSLTQYIERMDDTARTAGGTWWFDESDAPERKPWVAGTYPGYYSGPCGDGHQGTEQYRYILYGPGAADTDKAAEVVGQHWTKLGYTVRTVYRDTADKDNGVQIAVDLPNGASLGYTIGNSRSTVDGASACLASALFPQPK